MLRSRLRPLRTPSPPVAAIRRAAGALALAAAGSVAAAGQAPAAAAGEPPTHRISRAASAIVVDGRLDETAWDRATVLSLEYETRPGENVPPPVRTECLITFDADRFYVGFRAHDPEPAAIRAHYSDRDDAWDDDFVGVVLDPFNDRRRGFEFFVNPLGVQMDLFQDDVRGNEDSSWDAIWDAAGRITEAGYVVELAIPFTSLRFPATEEEQTWGIDAIRYYPRLHRHRLSIHPIDRDVSCYLCQATRITGIAGIRPGRNLEVAPTLVASRTDRREDFPRGELAAGEVDTEPGVTVSWGMTPSLRLSATLNPDFSQVEADAAQLDINERFALFFPEKRPFFLEGADIFDTRLDAVFTRTVTDPAWGLKLTGKAGPHAIGVFAARDELTNLILPGSQRSGSISLDSPSDDAALRYRRDFGDSSALGALFTSRSGDGYESSLAGVDGLYRVTEADSLRFQLLASRTRYPDALAGRPGAGTGTLNDLAGVIAYNRNSRDWNLWATYEDVGRDFRADLGFMPQVDYRLAIAGGERIWWGDDDDFYTRINLGGDWDRREDQDGNLLEQEVEGFFNLGGPRQSWLSVWGGRRERLADDVLFDETFYGVFVEGRPVGDLYLSLEARGGDQIDFDNNRLGEVLAIEPAVRYTLGLHLRFHLSHVHQRLDVDGGRLFTADLSQLRLVYQMSLRTFLRLVSQYTSVDRDPALYREPVEGSTRQLFNQLLFSYKLNPQTVLFLGYADTALGDGAVDLTRRDQTFFLKLGYAWVS